MIYEHLNRYNVLHDSQHAHSKKRTCDSQLVHILNDLAFNLDRMVVIDVVILDFSKAFDTVNHGKLLLKLNHYGINNWYNGQDFLTLRREFVSVDRAKSDYGYRRTRPLDLFCFCCMLMICLNFLIRNVSCLLTIHFNLILELQGSFAKGFDDPSKVCQQLAIDF